MRCTSCETRLDRYVEGTLSRRDMIDVSAHLATCEACREISTELHIVDALLATSNTPELPPNFTFALMAEARTLPKPAAQRSRLWTMLSIYFIATWTALALAAWKFGLLGTVRRMSHPLTSSFSHAMVGVVGAASSFSSATPLAMMGLFAIVAIDVALVGAIVAFYRHVRAS